MDSLASPLQQLRPNAEQFAGTEAPDSTRWSFDDITKCNQVGYRRPCQQGDTCSGTPRNSFPFAPCCKTPEEVVYLIDRDHQAHSAVAAVAAPFGVEVLHFGDMTELLSAVRPEDTGCIILDVSLLVQDGPTVQKWLSDSYPALPVVFTSDEHDISTVAHCMKAGAFDFIQRPFSDMQLRSVISSAIGESRKRHCAIQSQRFVRSLMSTLTRTELLVARHLSKGLPTKMIASDLVRSENTVKIHRHRIFKKLKVNSAASVANLYRFAFQIPYDSDFI